MADFDKDIDKKVKDRFLIIDKKLKEAFTNVKKDLAEVKASLKDNKDKKEQNKEVNELKDSLDKKFSDLREELNEVLESNTKESPDYSKLIEKQINDKINGLKANLDDNLAELKEAIKNNQTSPKTDNEKLKLERQIFQLKIKEAREAQKKSAKGTISRLIDRIGVWKEKHKLNNEYISSVKKDIAEVKASLNKKDKTPAPETKIDTKQIEDKIELLNEEIERLSALSSKTNKTDNEKLKLEKQILQLKIKEAREAQKKSSEGIIGGLVNRIGVWKEKHKLNKQYRKQLEQINKKHDEFEQELIEKTKQLDKLYSKSANMVESRFNQSLDNIKKESQEENNRLARERTVLSKEYLKSLSRFEQRHNTSLKQIENERIKDKIRLEQERQNDKALFIAQNEQADNQRNQIIKELSNNINKSEKRFDKLIRDIESKRREDNSLINNQLSGISQNLDYERKRTENSINELKTEINNLKSKKVRDEKKIQDLENEKNSLQDKLNESRRVKGSSRSFKLPNLSLPKFSLPKFNLPKLNVNTPVIKEGFWLAVPYIFLAILAIVAANQYFDWNLVSTYTNYWIAVGVLFGALTFWHNRDKIGSLLESRSVPEAQTEESIKISNLWYVLGILLILVIFIVSGLNHLGKFETVDEPKWIYDGGRVDQLYSSISAGNFAGTYINDKPGILPSYLSGLFVNNANMTDYNFVTIENYFFWSRFPLIIFNALLMILIIFLTSKLFNRSTALIFGFSLATFPLIIGMSQIVNPNATLWSTSIIAILSYFLFLKYNQTKYLWLSGIFLGLLSISKYFGNVIYYCLLLFFLIHISSNKLNCNKNKIINGYKNIFKIWFIALLIIFITFPATWVNPFLVLEQSVLHWMVEPMLVILVLVMADLFIFNLFLHKILFKIRRYLVVIIVLSLLLPLLIILINIFANYSLFSGEYISSFSHLKILLQSFHYLFFITPLSILLLLFLSLRKKSLENSYIINLFLFMVIFIFGSVVGGFVITPAYYTLLIPCLLLTTSVNLDNLVNEIPGKIYALLIILLFITSMFYVIYSSQPFYHTYENEFGYNNSDFITDSWGVGGYELAQIANERLPNNTKIWTDREGFGLFYKDRTNVYWRGKTNPFDKNLNISYLILTPGGEEIFTNALKDYKNGSRYLYARVAGETPILEYYQKDPEFQFCINENSENCLKFVKIEKISKRVSFS